MRSARRVRHMAWCEAIDFAEYIIKAMVTILTTYMLEA